MWKKYSITKIRFIFMQNIKILWKNKALLPNYRQKQEWSWSSSCVQIININDNQKQQQQQQHGVYDTFDGNKWQTNVDIYKSKFSYMKYRHKQGLRFLENIRILLHQYKKILCGGRQKKIVPSWKIIFHIWLISEKM